MRRPLEKDTRRKLTELYLYVTRHCEGHTHAGRVKINKLMFLADFLAYARRGQSITGANYIKLARGPVPFGIDEIRTHLIEAKQGVEREEPIPSGRTQHRFLAGRSADLSVFSAEDIDIAREVLESCRDATGEDLIGASHQFKAWQLAREKEDIPYASVAIPDDPLQLTYAEREWAAKACEEISRAAA